MPQASGQADFGASHLAAAMPPHPAFPSPFVDIALPPVAEPCFLDQLVLPTELPPLLPGMMQLPGQLVGPLGLPVEQHMSLPPLPPMTLPDALMLPAQHETPAPLPQIPTGPLVHWETHPSPHGAPYFHCQATGESRWVCPNGPNDVVAPLGNGFGGGAKATAEAPVPSAPAGPAPATDVKATLGEIESWETIGKTGWLRVETEKGFKYFFQKKTRKTEWTCPKEIAKEVAELDGVLGFSAPSNADSRGAASDKTTSTPVEGGNGPSVQGVSSAGGDKGGKQEVARKEESAPLTKAERRERQMQEENRSKENKRLLNFKQMLIEKGVKAFDKFEKWLPKLVADPRFIAVPGQKERKTLFDALSKRIDSERKKKAAVVKRDGREGFRELLAQAERRGLLHDRPIAAVQRALEERFEDDSRWIGVPERERDRLVAEAAEESTQRRKKEREEALHGFRALVVEKLRGREDDPPPFHVLRRKLEKDTRWEPVRDTAERERVYQQVVRELVTSRRQKQRRQRLDEDDVHLLKKKARLAGAEEELRNLFAERCKAPFGVEWEDARVALTERLRGSVLNDEEQERLWNEYKQKLTAVRREQFLNLLTNTSADIIGPEMSFEEVLSLVTAEPSVAKSLAGLPEELLQGTWQEWRQQAHVRVTEVCQHWLRSCEHFRGSEAIEPNGFQFEALLQRLSADVRFKRLGDRPDEQRRLVLERLQELRELKARGRPRGADEDDDV
eukprot:TRINITY_DN54964_c0_g1_i1.p1 TRINITY_DN54964_c0_g1~~TRINITY_DN54964_c0_g1_i1.p1  ORF type:complete len:855 (+),score=186.00 TRINITY_DN54964_c0_g1_i1:371-2566(+)